ncbi:MAG: FecR domain-containing protein [Kiloniellales bacterium]|nr:FecR domain-containing protein [Kiloniellales bacterium]
MSGSDAKPDPIRPDPIWPDPIREEALDWLLKAEAAPDDEALQAELAAWRGRSEAHEKAYRSVTRMWRLAGDLPADYAERAGARTPPRRSSGPAAGRDSTKPRRRSALRLPITVGGLAAALAASLLIVLAPTLRLHWQADHVSGIGEILALTLDDGSRLYLDAESAVAVDFDPARRSLELLAGRAFFDVAHDAGRPFVVAADGLSVTVTGTGFAVSAGQESLSVAVQSGAVEVRSDQSDTAVARLRAGDRLTMARETGTVTRSRVRASDVAAWREGQLVVDGAPLAEVVEAIDRHHRGVIWLRDATLAQRPVTGVFSLADPAAALEAAASAHGARVMALSPYILVVESR